MFEKQTNPPGVSAERLALTAALASLTLSLLFIVLRLYAWMISSSASMFAALADSIFDAAASGMNVLVLRYAMHPSDAEHRFGHQKAQSLAALAQASFIGGSALLLIAHSIERIQDEAEVQQPLLALTINLVTVIASVFLIMFQSYVMRRTRSDIIATDRLHFISDVFLNLGVLAALCLSIYGVKSADSVIAAGIGLVILYGAFRLGRSAVDTLLDRALPPQEKQRIIAAIMSCAGVRSLHDLKTRQAGGQYFIQCHLVLDGGQSLEQAHYISMQVEKVLVERFRGADISVHMEPDSLQTAASVNFITRDDGSDCGGEN